MNQHRQKQVYLFFGNQDLLVQENAEKCINDLLENRDRDWCFERYAVSYTHLTLPTSHGG